MSLSWRMGKAGFIPPTSQVQKPEVRNYWLVQDHTGSKVGVWAQIEFQLQSLCFYLQCCLGSYSITSCLGLALPPSWQLGQQHHTQASHSHLSLINDSGPCWAKIPPQTLLREYASSCCQPIRGLHEQTTETSWVVGVSSKGNGQQTPVFC